MPPILLESLIKELYTTYSYTVSLGYAMNYIEMSEYATEDDFHNWLQELEWLSKKLRECQHKIIGTFDQYFLP